MVNSNKQSMAPASAGKASKRPRIVFPQGRNGRGAGNGHRLGAAFPQAVIDELPGLFYVLDHRGKFLRRNRGWEVLVGPAGAGSDHPPIQELVFEADRSQVSAHLKAVLRAGEGELEARLNTLGGVRTFLFASRRVMGAGKPCVVGTAMDITQRAAALQCAEERLSEREIEMKAICTHTPLIMAVMDDACRLLKVNRSGRSFAGADAEHLHGLGIGAVVRCAHAAAHSQGCGFGPGCHACPVRRAVVDTAQTGRGHSQVEVGVQAVSDDKPANLTFLITTSRIEIRGQVRVLVTLQDVTASKRSEQELRKSEYELAQFFAASPLGILWVGSDGRVLRVNQSELDLLGRQRGEVLGQRITDLHADPEVAAGVLARVARGEAVQNQRARLRQGNGTLKDVLIDATGLWEKDQLVHSHWFVRDISYRVELEREISTISEREQRRLGHDLHDDLCQQLAGIQFLSESLAANLAARAAADSAQAREVAELIQRAMTQSRELARGLSPVGMEAEGLMAGLRELSVRTCKLFRIECHFRCLAPVLVSEPAMAIHLYRIAQEAVSNAVRHGKASRIEITLASPSGNDLRLSVADNGVGLPRRAARAKGMGLRIMRYRAGVIGGALAVERQRDGGTAVVCSVGGALLAAGPRHD